ncbi:MAG: O-antigen ligase family protein [Solirubrobacterales bacterium]
MSNIWSTVAVPGAFRSAAGESESARPFDTAKDVAGVLLLAALAAYTVVSGSPIVRLVLAGGIAASIIALFDVRPRYGLLALLIYLPLVALIRRFLIPYVGWTTNDPLLLVAPAVAGFSMIRLFVVEHRRFAADRLSYLVCALLAMVVIASLNPRNGSPAVGLGGLLFMGVPVLWFLIGREYLDRRTTLTVVTMLIPMAVVISGYGFFQSLVGLPSWDLAWVEIADYTALYLERDVTNTFATFASTAEYTLYMGVAIAAAVALALHGRTWTLIALPAILPAIFLSSSRTGFVFTLIAVAVMVVMRFSSPRRAPWILLACVGAIAFGSPAITSALQAGAQQTGDARVEYQLSGLGDPLNREQSTVMLHWEILVRGVKSGLTDPIGRGSGVTNNAIRRLGPGGENAVGQNTEVDISDAFVSMGLFGGLIFLALLVTGIRYAVKVYARDRDGLSLAILGILVVTFGNWLSGGHYAVTPLIWLLLGWTAAVRLRPAVPRQPSVAR